MGEPRGKAVTLGPPGPCFLRYVAAGPTGTCNRLMTRAIGTAPPRVPVVDLLVCTVCNASACGMMLFGPVLFEVSPAWGPARRDSRGGAPRCGAFGGPRTHQSAKPKQGVGGDKHGTAVVGGRRCRRFRAAGSRSRGPFVLGPPPREGPGAAARARLEPGTRAWAAGRNPDGRFGARFTPGTGC